MKLTHAPLQVCTRRFLPGWVRRVPQSGPRINWYVIACPGCGFTSVHFTDEGQFVESVQWHTVATPCRGCTRPATGPHALSLVQHIPEKDRPPPVYPVPQPVTLTARGAIPCPACQKRIRIVDNEIDAVGS